jgi:predicted nucleotidyltransferase
MDRTEKAFKILLELILFILSLLVISYLLNNTLLSIFLAFILVHTLNWIFNGQIGVLLKNLDILNTDKEKFFDYMDNVKEKVINENSIIAAAAFGSLSRKELKKTSDLDIRIIRKPGYINGIKACFFVLKERSKAFFNKFPLDIYVLDNYEMINIHIKNEEPVILYDPDKVLEKFLRINQ